MMDEPELTFSHSEKPTQMLVPFRRCSWTSTVFRTGGERPLLPTISLKSMFAFKWFPKRMFEDSEPSLARPQPIMLRCYSATVGTNKPEVRPSSKVLATVANTDVFFSASQWLQPRFAKSSHQGEFQRQKFCERRRNLFHFANNISAVSRKAVSLQLRSKRLLR